MAFERTKSRLHRGSIKKPCLITMNIFSVHYTEEKAGEIFSEVFSPFLKKKEAEALLRRKGKGRGRSHLVA